MKNPQLYKWLIVSVLLAVVVWASVEMLNRPLWGYLPLFAFWSFWNALVIVLGWNPIGNKKERILFFLPLLSGFFLALAFPPLPIPFIAMLGFVPLLLMVDRKKVEGLSNRDLLFAGYHAFINWNILATFWVANTAFAAGVFAIVVNSLLMLIPWALFLLIKNRMSNFQLAMAFIAFWMSFEFLHHRWELTWPWLTLGNALSGLPFIAQWYEYTGTMGGSLWILGGNWWLYLIIKRKIGGYSQAAKNLLIYRLLPWLIIPIVFSAILYYQEDIPPSDSIKVAVVQPNFEPHYEKFTVSYTQQLRSMLGQIDSALEEGAELVVLPETSLRVALHMHETDESIQSVRNLLKAYPETYVISGLNSFYVFSSNDVDHEFVRIHLSPSGDTTFWESHNSAGLIDESGLIDVYYKSKLVPGAEIFPFSKFLFFMEGLVDRLGGSTSGVRTQAKRSALMIGQKGFAPVICYESIFGEYHQGYFEAGAGAILIMTNDGWWDRTPGHLQHLYFGSLRAIEYRKEIARAANTGISGFIDQRGRIHFATEYEEGAVVIKQLNLNHHRTFYARNGDILGRLMLLLSLGFILLWLTIEIRKKYE